MVMSPSANGRELAEAELAEAAARAEPEGAFAAALDGTLVEARAGVPGAGVDGAGVDGAGVGGAGVGGASVAGVFMPSDSGAGSAFEG